MKKNKLNDRDFDQLMNDDIDHALIDPPDHLDARMLGVIRSYEDKKTTSNFFDVFTTHRLQWAFAVVVPAIIIPILVFYFSTQSNTDYTTLAFSRGEVEIIRDKTKDDSSTKIRRHDVLTTGDDAGCELILDETSKIIVGQQSQIQFAALKTGTDKRIKVLLDKGQAFFDISTLSARSTFEVETHDIIVRIVGTRFLVESIPGAPSSVTVEEGKVAVIHKHNKTDTLFLEEGNRACIKEETLTKTKANHDTLTTIQALKTIKTAGKDNTKQEMGTEEQKTDTTDDLKIIDGKQKERSTPHVKYQTKKIFTFSAYEGNAQKVIALMKAGINLVVVTESALACFNNKGTLVWQKQYGSQRNIYFMSNPSHFGNKIFVSSINKKMLVLNLTTGKEIAVVEAPGSIAFGYTPVMHQKTLYLPFQSGLYRMSPYTHEIDPEPAVEFNGPVTPVVSKNMVVLSSFVENRIAGYTLMGNTLEWEHRFEARSYSTPLIAHNYIYIGDTIGEFYKIPLDGTNIRKYSFNTPILSGAVAHNNNIYMIGGDGYLYMITNNGNKPVRLVKVEDNPVEDDFYYKTPTIHGNLLFFGNKNGEIFVLDSIINNIEKKFKASQNSITTSVVKHAGKYYFGTTTGELFMMN